MASAASSSSGKLSDFFSDHHPTTTFSSSRSSSSSTSSSFGSLSFMSYPKSSPTHDDSTFSLKNSDGVPFSWERQPGIPKNANSCRNRDYMHHSSLVLLPLPPALGSTLSKRFSFETFFTIWRKSTTCRSYGDVIQKDPFVKALMKCTSKEDEADSHHHYVDEDPSEDSWRNNEKRGSRALRDRFKLFDTNVGCRSTSSCSVVESKVLISKSGRTSCAGLSLR